MINRCETTSNRRSFSFATKGATRSAGLSLPELIVAMGILSAVALGGATFAVSVAEKQTADVRSDVREELGRDLLRALRDPRSLRASIEKTDSESGLSRLACLAVVAGGTRQPCSAMVSPAGLKVLKFANDTNPVTDASGHKCYSENGKSTVASATCDASHPVEVTATFQIVCIGQPTTSLSTEDGKVTVARAECSTNQAGVMVRYEVKPIAGLPKAKNFRPLKGSSFLEMKNLLSVNDVTAGSVVAEDKTLRKDLTSKMREFRRVCTGAGQVMVGIKADGEPLCQSITTACPPGQIFTGLSTSGSGASFSVNPVCVDITCPPNEVFVGLDAAGNAKCRTLASDTCSPYSGGIPNGRFMVGYQPPDAGPVCVKKTCLPGEIFGGYDSQGQAICGGTSFIPTCTPGGGGGGQNCSTPVAPYDVNPPPAGFMVSSESVGAIARGSTYQGVPWISAWNGSAGLPSQGRRNDYRNYGPGIGTVGNPDVGGLFGDAISGSGIQELCRNESDASNLTANHSWIRVTAPAYGNCDNIPAAEDGCSNYGRTGEGRNDTSYTCNYSRWPTRACCSWDQTPVVWVPPTFDPVTGLQNGGGYNTGGDWYCAWEGCCGGGTSTSRSYGYANWEGGEQCDITTNGAGRGGNHNGSSAHANCPTPHTWYGGVDNGSDFSPGTTKSHRYYNWTIRTSCNYRYER